MDIINQLSSIYEQLEPNTFEERFALIIQAPSTNDYFERRNQPDGEAKWQMKIDDLATEFMIREERWNEIIPILTSGHVAEGYPLGKAIGRLAISKQIAYLLGVLRNGLRSTEQSKRNYSVFSGIIAVMTDKVLLKEVFFDALDDSSLPEIPFSIEKEISLSDEELDQLMQRIEKGSIPPGLFLNFSYGWG